MKAIESYKEPKWVRIRSLALKRDKYLDQYLKRYGKLKQAEIVHHIFPVEEFPEYQYELWNLISITKSTHNLFHDRTTNELTKKGIELLIRTARRKHLDVPPKYLERR